MKTLHITTSKARNAEVKVLQKRLGGANKWKKNFRPGKVDGVYGPGTAGAVERAKFFMGYPKKKMRGGNAGVTFQAMLIGNKKLPLQYAARSKKRRRAMARAAARVPMRVKVLKLSRTQVGVKEKPAGSNIVKYSLWYRMTGPWCAMFTTWLYVACGSKVFKRGTHWAYVPYMLAAAYRSGSGLTRTADPQPGDLVLFDWQGDGEPDHIGVFEKWISKSTGAFRAIEGNTSTSSNSNGGEVQNRTDRNKSEVRAFVKVHG